MIKDKTVFGVNYVVTLAGERKIGHAYATAKYKCIHSAKRIAKVYLHPGYLEYHL